MRIFRGIIPALLVFSLIAANGHAQYGFEIHGLSAFGFDGEASAFGEHRVRDDWGGGALFFFSFIPAVRVEVGCDWIETKDRDLNDSSIRIAPLTAAIRAGCNLGDLYLYLGGGVGYALNELSPSEEAEREYARFGIYDLGFSNAPIYFALIGAEFAFSERLGVRCEYRYNRLRTNLTYQDWAGFEEQEKFNLDHQQVRAGLAVYF